ncbi:MBL fold metallo-hydrolase [Bythopirellula polymerisocia]|uniref:Putative quorum-quenching lactonase YtnP n=1 Tax=Bythopirellula polymerisocia TaxID=2528003 RepID=A0A5C6CRH2_9BACT|nr:MBL fold metallo-hydrolase [Bythopirellula polymerisocia]TWU26041.1 putative quorum-quenching lactonase YtnP [Bythopirellula polymerisocia]
MSLNLGNWQLDTVNGGMFRLDGGVMFGVVPQQIWKHVAIPDSKNRIQCANHCVLARDGSHTVLVDTGYGGKYALLDRKFYDMEPGEPLLEGLAQLGVLPEAVDCVVFSHLHFDHVGGSMRQDAAKRLSLTFPNAQHVVGRIEWENASSCLPELVTAYSSQEVISLRELTRLRLVEDGEEIVPGLAARLTGGHTEGHLSFMFRSNGQTACYPGDICPSTYHLRRMWHLSYDVLPLETRRNKPRLLAEAADDGWWMLWNHDPTAVVSRVNRDEKREFVAVDSSKTL